MFSLIEFNKEIRSHNFSLSHQLLVHVFSVYPYPENIHGCPCCVSSDDIEELKRGRLGRYLCKAMTTWGESRDFKHYIPQLFKEVYLDKIYDPFTMGCKLGYIKNWSDGEKLALDNWFYDYFQDIYISEFENQIQKSRLLAQQYLEGHISEMSCVFPFDVFFDYDLEDIKQFLPSKITDNFSYLLDFWPQNFLDLLVLADCLANNKLIECKLIDVFGKENSIFWAKKNEQLLEKQFWKTSNVNLQRLYSDALDQIKWTVDTL